MDGWEERGAEGAATTAEEAARAKIKMLLNIVDGCRGKNRKNRDVDCDCE